MRDDPIHPPRTSPVVPSQVPDEEIDKNQLHPSSRGDSERLPWRALHALARLRMFEALRYREYRLIWYAQISPHRRPGWTR